MKDVIEAFVKEIRPVRYLEIGLGDGKHFRSVEVPEKVGIDPKGGNINHPHLIYKGTSDDVFQSKGFKAENKAGFDLIFVDGLHLYEQCLRDIYNAFDHLTEDGVILVHDVWPFDMPDPVSSRERPPGNGPWCGDVYKVIFHFIGHCCWNRREKYIDYKIVESFPGWLLLWKTSEIPGKTICRTADGDLPFMNMNIDEARKLIQSSAVSSAGRDIEGAISHYLWHWKRHFPFKW